MEQHFRPVDPQAVHTARQSVIRDITSSLKKEMLELYERLTVRQEERFEQKEMSRRRLRNELLWYLSSTGDREAAERAYKHFSHAGCMSDKFYALISLTNMHHPEREAAFQQFYAEAKGGRSEAVLALSSA